jgi:hypothetical protein
MSEYGTVSDLVLAIERAWRPYQAYISTLTPEQLDGPTDDAGWTAKDHIAHVTAWEAGVTAVLQGRPRHEGMGITEDDMDLPDDDQINVKVREAYVSVSPEDIVEDAQLKHEGFLMELEALPEESVRWPVTKFLAPKSPEAQKVAAGDWVWGDSGDHYPKHLTYIRRILGEDVPDAG